MFAERRNEWSYRRSPYPRAVLSLTLTGVLVGVNLLLRIPVVADLELGGWLANLGSGLREWQAWRLFTSLFFRPDPFVLAWDALALLVLGTLLERRAGAGAVAWHWFGAGVLSGLLTLVSSDARMEGCAAANVGLLIGLLVRFPDHRILTLGRRIPLATLALGVVAVQVLLSFWRSPSSPPELEFWGFCAGGLGALHLGYWHPRLVAPRLERRRTRRDRRRAVDQITESLMAEPELDRILEKINREGMDGLTAVERRFLKRMSASYQDTRDR